jgi:hypothetical protein
VHGDADGAGLVGDRAGDRLPDPARRIGGELVAAAVLEFVDRLGRQELGNAVQDLHIVEGLRLPSWRLSLQARALADTWRNWRITAT